ncbi:MAG: MFS transporter [bacterium]
MEQEIKFSALRVRDFRLFWLSQIISLSGTWMQQVAIGWLVYSATRSPFYLGLTMAVMSAPIVLFTLIGGITADRYPKKNIIILTQALFIMPAFTLGILSGIRNIELWQLFVLVFLIGTLNAFDTPARQSYIVELVGKGNLLNAIALNSAAFNSARVIGPVLAGVLIAKFSIASCFYLNAVSYIPVILVLLMVKERGVVKVSGRTSIIKELMNGLSYIKHEKRILSLFLVIAVISLFGLPYSNFLPVIAKDVLRTGASGLGRLAGAAGVGALMAAMIIAFRGNIRRRFLLTSISMVGATAAIFLLTYSRREILSLAFLFFSGLGFISFFAISNNFIQQTVPDNLRGRVMSVYILVFLGMAPFGNFIVGSAAHRMGTMNALRLSAAICLIASLLYIRYHQKYIGRAVGPGRFSDLEK